MALDGAYPSSMVGLAAGIGRLPKTVVGVCKTATAGSNPAVASPDLSSSSALPRRARLQHDHRSRLRSPRGIALDVIAHLLPPRPQVVAFLPNRGAPAHCSSSTLELHDDIWMRLQVEPPGGL